MATHHCRLVRLGRISLLVHVFNRKQPLFPFLVIEYAAPDMLEPLLDLALLGKFALAKCLAVIVVAANGQVAPLCDLLVHDVLYYLCFEVLSRVALLGRTLPHVCSTLL